MKKIIITENNIKSCECTDRDEFEMVISALCQILHDCKKTDITNEQASEQIKQMILDGLNEIDRRKNND